MPRCCARRPRRAGPARLCHVLKSVAGALGAQALAASAVRVEAGEMPAPALADQLQALVEALRRALGPVSPPAAR